MIRQLKIVKQVTSRDTASLDKYLTEISRLNLITAEEEVELAKLIRQGSDVALDKLTKANLRFVVSVAKQYQNQGLTLPDLINEGNLGLMKAAKRFDETRGFKFISYAVWWIRQSIIQAISEQSRIVRLPLNRVNHISKVTKAFARLEQEFEREPSTSEISEMLEMTEGDVRETLRSTGRHLSMDAPLYNSDDNTITLHDTLTNNENTSPIAPLLKDSLSSEIKRALKSLSFRESEVLKCFYGIGGIAPMTLDEISEKFDLTSERIRQIKDKSLKKLRASKDSNSLRVYLS